jgi:16S rRNA (cytosine1402-N4)-methyltransferase
MNDGPPRPHVRRPRYRGTHPRAFHEKYKELNPERYGDEVARVLASGKTPAGMHRPIMVREILDVLAPEPGDLAVDATLGHGGHAAALLDAVLPGGRLLALDVDPIELPKTESRLRARGIAEDVLFVRRSNFAGLSRVLADAKLPPADVVIADLGLSSMQIDDPVRGFTFKHEGPLDLRMNPRRGQPASVLLASIDVTRLTKILADNGDLPGAASMAHALVEHRRRQPIATTLDLARVVREVVMSERGEPVDSETQVRRVFQALRIEVNDEFGALDTFLRQLPECVASGGRIAILTFHSGEDRRVKQAFRAGEAAGLYARIAQEVTRATTEERRANPRSTSAKLRWAVRT